MKITTLASPLLLAPLFGACLAADGADIDTDDQTLTACADVAIITARASTEAPGEGITGDVVDQIIATSDQNITRASVNYPATLNNYNNSSLAGINALKTQLTTEVQNCPNEKIVLAGYSQGAHVVLDVLGGGQGGSLGTATAPVAANISSHVTAVVTFGDPRHVPNQAFNLGTSTRNGRFPRSNTQLQNLGTFASRIHAWCDRNDTFCDSGFSTNVHLTYLNRYQNAAVQFVIGKIGG
ncbi:MAG TPA: cutinase family protein [Kofleriaceae bacterium]|nr:cutinase family protein [Kofleriaceae bacterium]